MKIGIIGAGNIGTALVKRLKPQGHQFMLSFSKDTTQLAKAASSFGATAGSVAETVAWAEVVVLAVPWAAVPEALKQAGDLAGKTLWDCTNALKPDYSGLVIGTITSGGEEVAKLAPKARVVKGIPPFAEVLHSDNPTVNGQPVGVFVAGNDAEAKTTIASLLSALPATVTDAGGLDAARLIEPAMTLLVRLAYGMGMGARIALQVSHEQRK
jgi:predicted dinucleotide-binding enzyme